VNVLRRLLLGLAPRRRMREAFASHYRNRGWLEAETVSGRGSTLQRTAAIRAAIPDLLRELAVHSVLDAGCGDFNWFGTMGVELDRYVGVEVVPELAAEDQRRFGDAVHHFVALDVTRDPLPRADLVLCRDCLVHLKTRQALAALDNFRRSGATWLLATTFTGDHANADAPLGGWRPLNLARAPFELGEPLRLLSEAATVEDRRYADKSLGLWPLQPGRREGGA
jgi:hypothetical protein